jgi:hypothetical protein
LLREGRKTETMGFLEELESVVNALPEAERGPLFHDAAEQTANLRFIPSAGPLPSPSTSC